MPLAHKLLKPANERLHTLTCFHRTSFSLFSSLLFQPLFSGCIFPARRSLPAWKPHLLWMDQSPVRLPTNCNKFYCNLTFYKLNTYLILTSACLVLWSKNVSTDKNFLRNILVTRGDPFVCACPRLRSSRCRQTNVESSSLYFWSPENKLCGEVGWVYPCEDKVSI